RPADPVVIYLDAHVVVVGKPSGLVVHPGWGGRGEPTTMTWLRDELGHWVYPVHRLDRATSGVLVMARSSEAARRVSERWDEAEKTYLALVRGTPPAVVDLDHAVRRELKGSARVPARTTFRFIARSLRDRCSLLLAQPHTGRLHQIRRHLKHLSHPIVGDTRYGHGVDNRHYRAQWGLHRLGLHAARLRLPAPFAPRRWIDVTAPVPADLAEPLARLGLPSALGDIDALGALP
ncbi:MAG: pseudouridine synthase, partial [Myxococcota bacterium]